MMGDMLTGEDDGAAARIPTSLADLLDTKNGTGALWDVIETVVASGQAADIQEALESNATVGESRPARSRRMPRTAACRCRWPGG